MTTPNTTELLFDLTRGNKINDALETTNCCRYYGPSSGPSSTVNAELDKFTYSFRSAIMTIASKPE